MRLDHRNDCEKKVNEKIALTLDVNKRILPRFW